MLLRSILALFMAALAFSSCKQDDDWSPPPASDTTVATFGISGDTAVQVMRAHSVNTSLFLSDSGARQVVSLSISGLPPGVTAEIDPPSGTPPYYSTVHFSASVYAVGGASSSITVLAVQADGVEKRHSIKVSVVENPSCTEIAAGAYRGYGCGSGGYISTVTIDSALPQTRIRFKGFLDPSFRGYADLNCADSTVVFPPQNFVSGHTISGTGRYTRDTLKAEMMHVWTWYPQTGQPGQTMTEYCPMMFARQ